MQIIVYYAFEIQTGISIAYHHIGTFWITIFGKPHISGLQRIEKYSKFNYQTRKR